MPIVPHKVLYYSDVARFQFAIILNIYGIEEYSCHKENKRLSGFTLLILRRDCRQTLDSSPSGSRACDSDVGYHPLSVFNVHAVTARVEPSLLECYKDL